VSGLQDAGLHVEQEIRSAIKTSVASSWHFISTYVERVSCQNKFMKLVHLVGFITNKFVTIHGHMNVK